MSKPGQAKSDYFVVSDEIKFGQVEEAGPRHGLRPDLNAHFAVAAYGEPEEGELPIFVDLDTFVAIEEHARSDMSVELGGVLLGGSYLDGEGRPFVVISDMLAADHYESTKGSFKFTHETWSEISRQRQRLAPELAMVGWYHTHPGWGVFLSGMDLFICEHFFGKPLDVALVVDPCRGDRGMFQWTAEEPRQTSAEEPRQTQRTGGFFVTTSRFRAAQLEHYVAELGSMRAFKMAQRYLPVSSIEARPERPLAAVQGQAWILPALMGGMAIQCVLLAVIALQLLAPADVRSAGNDSEVHAALEKVSAALVALDARRDAELAAERSRARTEFLDAAFRELKDAEDGSLARLAAKFDQSERLAGDVRARDAEIRELRSAIDDARSKLQSSELLARRAEKSLSAKIDELAAENGRLKVDLEKNRQLTLLDKPAAATAGTAGQASSGTQPETRWWWLSGGVLVAVAMGAGVWWLRGRSAAGPVHQESA